MLVLGGMRVLPNCDIKDRYGKPDASSSASIERGRRLGNVVAKVDADDRLQAQAAHTPYDPA